jgi:hypothetical protein
LTFSPNLELQKSSVQRDHPNPGPNLSERVDATGIVVFVELVKAKVDA